MAAVTIPQYSINQLLKINLSISLSLYIDICVCVCIHIHIYAYIYTQTHHNSFYCILLYWASHILQFPPKLKVGGNCTSSRSIGYFSSSICLFYVSASCFGNPHNISNIFNIIIFVMAICYQWSLMLLLQFTEVNCVGICISVYTYTHTHPVDCVSHKSRNAEECQKLPRKLEKARHGFSPEEIQSQWHTDFELAELWEIAAAAALAKLLQSCPTLCDPWDGSPPGSPVPGILQARTLEWVAISFSNAGKWKLKGKSLSRVRLLATPWTAAHQAPPSMGFCSRSTGVGCHCLLRWEIMFPLFFIYLAEPVA